MAARLFELLMFCQCSRSQHRTLKVVCKSDRKGCKHGNRENGEQRLIVKVLPSSVRRIALPSLLLNSQRASSPLEHPASALRVKRTWLVSQLVGVLSRSATKDYIRAERGRGLLLSFDVGCV